MLHIESSDKIYFTREYNQFKILKGNRTLNEKKIGKIINEINSGFNMLPYCPIIVDTEMNIIDGQHRFEVAKRIDSNIFYTIADKTSLYHIAKLNTNTERWSSKDFINCYSELGIEDYKTLDSFLRKYGMPKTASINLLEKGSPNQSHNDNCIERFESGNFRVQFLEKAEDLAKLIYRFKTYKGFLTTDFILTIYHLSKNGKCDMEDLIRLFLIYKEPLEHAQGMKQIKVALEQIYNYKKSIRRIIF